MANTDYRKGNDMMNNIIRYAYNTKINLSNFDNKVWNKFIEIIRVKSFKKVYLDFQNVEFVAPLVLPRLCYMGVCASRLGVELEIIINGVSDLKSYLAQLGFFDIVKKYKILTIDEGTTGGEIKKDNATKAFFCFNKEEILRKYGEQYEIEGQWSEKDILKVYIRMELLGQSYKNEGLDRKMISQSKVLSVLQNISHDYKILEDIALDYVELIHNSIWHGNALCFFALQVGQYENKYHDGYFKKVEVSIMDTGKGLYQSLINKDWLKENKTTQCIELDSFKQLKSIHAQDFYSAIEMIIYRKNEKIRGVYQVMDSMREKQEVKLILTNRSARMEFDEYGLKMVMDKNLQLKQFVDWYDIINMGFGMDISFNI